MSKLITKDQAHKCDECGKPLWRPASRWYANHYGDGRMWYGTKRLGYEPVFRVDASGIETKKVCWNGKQCKKRQERHDA